MAEQGESICVSAPLPGEPKDDNSKREPLVFRVNLLVNTAPPDKGVKFHVYTVPTCLPKETTCTAEDLSLGLEIPPDTRLVHLETAETKGPDGARLRPVYMIFRLAELPPPTSEAGAHFRMANRGYQFRNWVDGRTLNPGFWNRCVVSQFRKVNGLTRSSELDAALRDRIAAEHDKKGS